MRFEIIKHQRGPYGEWVRDLDNLPRGAAVMLANDLLAKRSTLFDAVRVRDARGVTTYSAGRTDADIDSADRALRAAERAERDARDIRIHGRIRWRA